MRSARKSGLPSFIPTVRSVAGSHRSRVPTFVRTRGLAPREELYHRLGLSANLADHPNPEGNVSIPLASTKANRYTFEMQSKETIAAMVLLFAMYKVAKLNREKS